MIRPLDIAVAKSVHAHVIVDTLDKEKNMKHGFIGQQIGKLAIIGIFILMAVIGAIVTIIDIQSAHVPAGITVADASLTILWTILAIGEIASYVKWRKLVFVPDTVCIITADREITVTACKELKDILSLLTRHGDLFTKGIIGLAMDMYNPENERVEVEHIPLEEYLVDQKPTVDEKSPKEDLLHDMANKSTPISKQQTIITY